MCVSMLTQIHVQIFSFSIGRESYESPISVVPSNKWPSKLKCEVFLLKNAYCIDALRINKSGGGHNWQRFWKQFYFTWPVFLMLIPHTTPTCLSRFLVSSRWYILDNDFLHLLLVLVLLPKWIHYIFLNISTNKTKTILYLASGMSLFIIIFRKLLNWVEYFRAPHFAISQIILQDISYASVSSKT